MKNGKGQSSFGSLDSFFAASPEMLFVADEAGALLRWSHPLERALSPRITQGAPLVDLAHPEDRGVVRDAWSRLLQTPEPVLFDARLPDAAGAHRLLTCLARRSPGDGAIHGSIRDSAAAPVSAEAGVLDPRHLLRAVVGNIPIALWAIDRDGIYTYLDGMALESAGLRRGQHLGQNLFELYADLPDAMRDVRRALTGEPLRMSTEVHGIHWDSWLLPVRGDQGKVTSLIGFSLDVSEAKRTEQELRAQLDRVEAQQQVIRDLSTPIIEVWDGVLTLPMVGVLDTVRTADVMESLLTRITQTAAQFAILDLTGVEVVDTKVASHLISLISAIRLLGAEGLITGIKPTVAQTMVALGLDLTRIVTRSNLKAGLRYCIQRTKTERAGVSP